MDGHVVLVVGWGDEELCGVGIGVDDALAGEDFVLDLVVLLL